MKNMSLLFCHPGSPFAPQIGGFPLNDPRVVSCLIWAIVVIILGAFVLCYLKKRLQFKKDMAAADRQHELSLKDKAYQIEEKWFEKNKQAKDDELTRKTKEYNELTKQTKDDELTRKTKEYNELTIHQKIMDKVTGVDKEMEDLKKAFEELKKKYEVLDGEIEHIIIKKKQ